MRFFRVIGWSCSTCIIRWYTSLSGYLSPWSTFHVYLSKTLALKKMLSNKEQQYITCTSFQEKFYDTVSTPSNHNIHISLNGIELFWDNSKSSKYITQRTTLQPRIMPKKKECIFLINLHYHQVVIKPIFDAISAPILTPWKYFYHTYA